MQTNYMGLYNSILMLITPQSIENKTQQQRIKFYYILQRLETIFCLVVSVHL